LSKSFTDHFATVAADYATFRPRYPAELFAWLAAGAIDLVTAAQALHWFDVARFFAEARRVLIPEGVLAVWTYGPSKLDGEGVDALVQSFYRDTVGPYWPPERAWVDVDYLAIIEIPFDPVSAPEFHMAASWTLSQLLGYFRTWSATARYIEANGSDPVEELGERLLAPWGPAADRRTVTWPLTLRIGRA
jgi:SAM-dependent methyltransferase